MDWKVIFNFTYVQKIQVASETTAAPDDLLDTVSVAVDMIYKHFNSEQSFVQKHCRDNSLWQFIYPFFYC